MMTELQNSNTNQFTYLYSLNKQPVHMKKARRTNQTALPLVECRALTHSAPHTHTSQSPSLAAIITKSSRAT